MRAINLTGMKFGRLSVAKLHDKVGSVRRWECVCDCGNTTIVRGHNLPNSSVQSCGCLSIEKSTRHGKHKSLVYKVWQGMKTRCLNKNNPGYKSYGGRGIGICKRWMKFENFLADMGERPVGMSIDRRDNDGNYEPGNCRWATRQEQMNNTSKNRTLVFMGRQKTVTQWSRELNITTSGLIHRIERGWDCKDVFRKEKDIHRNGA